MKKLPVVMSFLLGVIILISAYYFLRDNTGDVTVTDCATIKYDARGQELWVTRYNGPGNSGDYAAGIAIDKCGNTYVTGSSNTGGFLGHGAYTTIKYDREGQQLWISRYAGPSLGVNMPHAIALDGSGNTYVTGESSGPNNTVDFATVKYDNEGRELWVARYTGPRGINIPNALSVDASGNVYVSGFSRGNEEADDIATIKYDSKGGELWVARYSNGESYAMTLDPAGNVYVSGFTRINGGDYVTIKYDNVGNQLWAATYDGPRHSQDVAYDLVVDGQGSIFITGRSAGVSGTGTDFATVKYDGDGQELWVARYHGPKPSDDEAHGLAIDSAGDVYVTGQSGPGLGGRRMTTIKYDTDGNELWVSRYSPSENVDSIGESIVVDASGNVYVAGENGTLFSAWDYAVVKYDSNGTLLWTAGYNGPENDFDHITAMVVDDEGNVYVTGESGIMPITIP